MKASELQASERVISIPSNWVIPAVLASSFFLISSLLLSTTYFRDTIDFAMIIERSQDLRELFNPHHLLYLFVARLNFDLWRFLGYQGSSLVPSQMLGVMVGTLGIVLAYQAARSIVRVQAVALWLTVLIGFSYALWAYAMQGMPYVFTITLSLLFFVQLIANTRMPTMRQALVLGLAHGLLTLFHQSTLLLLPIGVLTFFLSSQQLAAGGRVKRAAAYVLLYVALVGVPYIIVMLGVYKFTSAHDMYLFLTAYIQDALNQVRGIGVLQPSRFGMGIFGLGNTIVGEIFAIDLLARTSLYRTVMISTLTGWTQPVSQLPLPLMLVLVPGLVLVVAGFVFFVVYAVRNWKRLWTNYRLPLLIAGAWFVLLGAFAEYYYPENRQQWIPAFVPFWMLFGIAADDFMQNGNLPRTLSGRRWLLATLAMFLFAVNLFGSIVPSHIPQENANLEIGQSMRSLLQPGDLVLASEAGNYKHATAYIEYFDGNQVLSVIGLFDGTPGAQTAYEQQIRNTLSKNKRVYVLGEVFDQTLVIPELAKYSGMTTSQVLQRIGELFAGYQLRLVSPVDAPIGVYEVSTR